MAFTEDFTVNLSLKMVVLTIHRLSHKASDRGPLRMIGRPVGRSRLGCVSSHM